MKSHIIPAILTNSLSELTEKVRVCEQFASAVHIDIADSQLVANTTVSLTDALTVKTGLPREFHLMVVNPSMIFNQSFAALDRVIIHVEALTNAAMIADWRNQLGERLVLAINPSTSLTAWLTPFKLVDRVVVMGVEPGFQGAPFIPETITRVRELRLVCPDLEITVDGGVGPQTIEPLIAAGANRLIVGSAIWQTADPVQAYQHLLDQTVHNPPN